TNNVPIDRVIGDPMRVSNLATRAQKTIAAFARMLRAWRVTAGLENVAPAADAPPTPRADEPSLRLFVEDVIRASGLHDAYLNDASDPDHERLANLGEFITFTQQFEEDYAFDVETDGATQPPTLRDKLLAMLEQ